MTTGREREVRERLAALNSAQLGSLLQQRQLMTVPWPGDLDQLAHRLTLPESIADAYLQLPLPSIEVLSAVMLCGELGEPATEAAVCRLLGAAESEVASILAGLSELQLAWISDGVIAVVSGLPIFGRRLGVPIEQCLDAAPLAVLRPMSTKLGLRAEGLKPEVASRLRAFFDDPAAILSIVDSASTAERKLLHNAAQTDSMLFPHNVYLSVNSPGSWSVARGLAWRLPDGTIEMPIQVTLALLGPDWSLPFYPQPPEVVTRSVSSEQVEAEAATRVLRMVELVSNIVEVARTAPITLLKSGTIGVRTVRGLAKDLHSDNDDIEVALALALVEGLLDVEEPAPPKGRKRTPTAPSSLVASDTADRWQASDGGVRAGTLLQSWWDADFAILLGDSDVDFRQGSTRNLRRSIARVHASLPSDRAFAEESNMWRLLSWERPYLQVESIESRLALLLREAELMGVVALGSGTSLGRALVAGDTVAAATQLVASAHTRANIGADLTAVVLGPPDTALARFFDAVADRESTGSATTWRFGQSSVREAFDAGFSLSELLGGLDSFAAGDVPQALTYLVNDVARTHGSISVMALGCVVIAEDDALIAEIAVNRRLTKLGALALAPTVVGFSAGAEIVTSALRDAGYAPVQRDSSGQVTVTRTPVVEADQDRRYPVPKAVDFALHAEHLMQAEPAAPLGRRAFAGVPGEGSDPTARLTFSMGLRTWVEYQDRIFVAHSATQRGEMVEVWNETDGRYETFDIAEVRRLRRM